MTSANRQVIAVGWITVMVFVWAIFVPARLSSTTFALIAAAGLFITFCGAALLNDSQAPRSVSAILADLERDGGPASMKGANNVRP